MKKIVYLALIMLFVTILSACAKATPQPVNEATPQSTDEMINPGDKIGDFLITTGKDGDFKPRWDLDWIEKGDGENVICNTTVGTNISPSFGIYGSNLEEKWLNHKYDMFIEDRPVNLQAFGYIDISYPNVGKMRLWNVVIVATKPGEISIRDSGSLDGESFETLITFIFSPQ